VRVSAAIARQACAHHGLNVGGEGVLRNKILIERWSMPGGMGQKKTMPPGFESLRSREDFREQYRAPVSWSRTHQPARGSFCRVTRAHCYGLHSDVRQVSARIARVARARYGVHYFAAGAANEWRNGGSEHG
jgi:hypothetical protein